ncbi:MAG: MATE family efflux transporter [Lachnospiraceae bacterium]|nr:MATE family efflux transporter [Candidatus Merdinaster equi]
MKDLTKGFPAKIIFIYTIPIILGNILQQIYNFTDSKIVSMYVSTDALAAVGNTSVISGLVIGFIIGLTQGYTILVARSFGAKNMGDVRRYVGGTFVLSSVFGIVMMALSIIFTRQILTVLNTPEEIMDISVSYLIIILAGSPFVIVYNACSNVLRAVGDSRRPLYFLILSLVVNIGLDILFVGPLNMGTDGAAYATIAAQFVCAVCCLIYMIIKTKELFPKDKDEWIPGKKECSKLLPLGFSMAMMSSIVNIGTVILQWAINSLGTVYVTAHIAARRIFTILMCCIYSFGFSITNYVSQNMGAGEFGRVRKGILHGNLIVTGITVVLCAICHAWGDELVVWIVSDPNAIDIIQPATDYIKIGVVFYYALGPLFILRCALQGMGLKTVPIITSILECLTKVVFAFGLVPSMGYFGIILTEPISWCIMTAVLTAAYLVTARKGIENIRV